MRTKTGSVVAAMFLSAVMSVSLLTLSIPAIAYAVDSSKAYSEFSDAELARLFEITSSYDDCEFVMHDYVSGKNVYLKVRSQYRSKYDSLVNPDSVRPLADEVEEARSIENVISGMPLEEISFPGYGVWSPWRDILALYPFYEGIANHGLGSAFMVSSNVAITAAHCIAADGVSHITVWPSRA